MNTAIYDNTTIPQYESEEEELAELMRFYQFAYKKSSGYNGTVLYFYLFCYLFSPFFVLLLAF